MRQVSWAVGPYTVTSYGNGTAYELVGPDGQSVYLQGDDAYAWREEHDAAPDAVQHIRDTLADHATE